MSLNVSPGLLTALVDVTEGEILVLAGGEVINGARGVSGVSGDALDPGVQDAHVIELTA